MTGAARLDAAALDAMPAGSIADDTDPYGGAGYLWTKNTDGWRIDDGSAWPPTEPGLTGGQLDHLYGPIYPPRPA